MHESSEIRDFAKRHKLEVPILKQRREATLYDLSDKVACLEWHKNDSSRIDEPVLALLEDSLELVEREKFNGLVILGSDDDFAKGSDINTMIEAVRRKDWEWIKSDVERRRALLKKIRYSKFPVVSALHGHCLGLACELALHSSKICAHKFTKMGFSEISAGLIPSGGGIKEVMQRFSENSRVGGPFPPAVQTLDNILNCWSSENALEAKNNHYLARRDIIVEERGKVLITAKNTLLRIARSGYRAAAPYMYSLPGLGGYTAMQVSLRQKHSSGIIDDHMLEVGEKLAYVVCGGDCNPSRPVSEEHVLKVGKGAFLDICKMKDTLKYLENALAERSYI